MRALTLLLPITGAVLVACGGRSLPKEEAQTDAGPSFIARQGDFDHFTNWEAFDGGTTADDMLDGGLRTIYLNRRPPSGSLFFPLGTILVKTTEGAQTFAMVKRGGGFNPITDNWEWFELSSNPDGTVEIVWRGTGPPSTFAYGDMGATGCNGCHLSEGYENDDVAGSAVLLSSF